MRGVHTAALFAVVALALCAGGAADTNTPQTRGAGASNIGTAGARPSLNITTTAERSQGSDADELTRRRRPVKDKDHGHEPPKHDEPDWCYPMLSCNEDSDCLDQLPCQKTYCKQSNRGKQGQKEGNCVCKGPRDDGCSCLDGCDPDDLSAAKKACLNTNQKCKCNQVGTCKPNYLPEDTYCDYDALNPMACEVGKCSTSGECKSEPRDAGSACYAGVMLCENAGKCKKVDGNSPICERLDCIAQCENPESCSATDPCCADSADSYCCAGGECAETPQNCDPCENPESCSATDPCCADSYCCAGNCVSDPCCASDADCGSGKKCCEGVCIDVHQCCPGDRTCRRKEKCCVGEPGPGGFCLNKDVDCPVVLPWTCQNGDGCTKNCGRKSCTKACQAQFQEPLCAVGDQCNCDCDIDVKMGGGECNNFGGCPPMGTDRKKCCQCRSPDPIAV